MQNFQTWTWSKRSLDHFHMESFQFYKIGRPSKHVNISINKNIWLKKYVTYSNHFQTLNPCIKSSKKHYY